MTVIMSSGSWKVLSSLSLHNPLQHDGRSHTAPEGELDIHSEVIASELTNIMQLKKKKKCIKIRPT